VRMIDAVIYSRKENSSCSRRLEAENSVLCVRGSDDFGPTGKFS
jgi:hypothetical protein